MASSLHLRVQEMRQHMISRTAIATKRWYWWGGFPDLEIEGFARRALIAGFEPMIPVGALTTTLRPELK